ncbi:MAG: Uncharacterized protein FD127_1569 [Acidimicrobiaceae bacterium]|jgi:hypothetical protein|nr:MAG: Uncharacterized protein FD127_1569 [Acidimicrobiaceae bacterium]
MPFCEDCAKYWAPSAMNDDGTCPTCGRTVEAPKVQSTITAKNLDLKRLAVGDDGDPADAAAPWHFKLLMVLLVVYLGWRFVQLLT